MNSNSHYSHYSNETFIWKYLFYILFSSDPTCSVTPGWGRAADEVTAVVSQTAALPRTFNFPVFLLSVSRWEPQSSCVPTVIHTVLTFECHQQSKFLLSREWQQQLLIVLSLQGNLFHSNFTQFVYFFSFLFREKKHREKKSQRETVNRRHCFRSLFFFFFF